MPKKKKKSKGIKTIGPGLKMFTRGPRKGKYIRTNGPSIIAIRKNGNRVRSNATVSMPLKSLRRLISSARTGKRTSTKVRVRP